MVHSISFDIFIWRSCLCTPLWAPLNAINWEQTAVVASFAMTKTEMWLQSFLLEIFSRQILIILGSSRRMLGNIFFPGWRQGEISPLSAGFRPDLDLAHGLGSSQQLDRNGNDDFERGRYFPCFKQKELAWSCLREQHSKQENRGMRFFHPTPCKLSWFFPRTDIKVNFPD